MNTEKRSGKIYEVGPFRLDTGNRILLREGVAISLTPKSYDLLELLVERRGDVLQKDQLMERVWPGTFVEEANLSHHIYLLRKVLGDDKNGDAYIETVPKRGYRFVAPVRELSSGREVASDRFPDAPAIDARLLAESGVSGGASARPAASANPSADSSDALTATRVAASPAGAPTRPASLARSRKSITFLTVAISVLALGVSWFAFRRQQQPVEHAPGGLPYLTAYQGMESQPTLSPDGRRVAFTWDGEAGDNWDIYVKVVGAESRLRLTNSPSQESSPAWSPDGEHIAFRRNTGPVSGFYVVPVLGGAERKVASAFPIRVHHRGRSLDWTPDGRLLLVTDRESVDEPWGLYKLDMQTGERIRLVAPRPPSTGVMGLAVSPDGTHVAFARLNDPHPDHTRTFMDLYVMPLAGGVPRRLTFDDEFVVGMTWTPDSQEIVFSCFRSAKQTYEWGYTLWRIAYRGGEPRLVSSAFLRANNPTISRRGNRLVYEERQTSPAKIWRQDLNSGDSKSALPARIIGSARTDSSPQISPDSKKLAVVSFRTGTNEIWLSDVDGANAFQLTSLDIETAVPRWSPDGARIVFRSSGTKSPGIYVVDVTTRASRKLETGHSEDGFPNFSGDGRWIYFSSLRTGSPQIWKIPADSGKAVQVTRDGGEESEEAPDGKFLYFTRPKGLLWTYRETSLWKVPVEGGPETLVMETIHSGYWCLTQNGMCYLDTTGREDLPFPIQFLDFGSGKKRLLTQLFTEPQWNLTSISASRDGRWLVYPERERMQRDLILVENFR